MYIVMVFRSGQVCCWFFKKDFIQDIYKEIGFYNDNDILF